MSNTTDSILVRLHAALDADGDFPTRAKVITEIRELTENPMTPIDVIVDTIMSEPTLATRILHIVNSVYYARAQPIENISQAVIHTGLKSIYNLCANFVVLQRFTPLVKKGGAFYFAFLNSMIASNLASYLDGASSESDKDEEGYLSGSLFTLGPLLLGYYFPKLFVDAEKRSVRKRISLYKSIEEVLGVPAVRISLDVVDSLSIPAFYKNILSDSFLLYQQKGLKENDSVRASARSVAAATLLGETILENPSIDKFREKVSDIAKSFNFEYSEVERALCHLPIIAEQQSKLLGLQSMEMPDSLLKFIKGETGSEQASISSNEQEDSPLTPYLEQLEQAINDNETLASVIATVMESLVFAFDFERVVYLETDLDYKTLSGKLGLGDKLETFEGIEQIIPENPFSEEVHLKSFLNKSIETFGSPLFENGWPFAAIPVGYEDRTLGVIYADLVDSGKAALETRETVALSLLADIMDRAIQKSRV